MFEQRVQRSMEAFGRKDLAAIMAPWADDGVFELAGHTVVSGRYEGKASIEALFRRIFARLESVTITVRHAAFANPLGLTRNNTIYVESEVVETSTDGVTIHDERIAVYEWRGGKLVSVREWAFDPTIVEALWSPAGAPDPA